MSKERFRNLYDSLLQTDELFVMFAGMTGEWEKDKNSFIKAQKELEDIINFKDVTDAEEIN